MSPRFTVRAVSDGFGIHDLQTGQLLEQPGLGPYWFVSESRAQAWVDREAAAASPGVGDWALGAQVRPPRVGYEARRV